MKHNIVLKGYGAYLPTTPSKLLRLGTAESYGVEQLHITPGADWENLLIKATFHPPSGDSVVVLLGEDGIIDVPPEATAVAAGEYNPGLIVFSGVSDGVQRISADIAYTVLGHAPVDGKDSEPSPNQWEQLAAQYQSKIDKQQGAENAGKVLGIGEDGLVKPVEQTGGGGVGNNGATFIPSVSEEGVISWTNDGDLPNPEPVNIKGAPGKPGDNYALTEADKQEIAGMVEVPGGGTVAVIEPADDDIPKVFFGGALQQTKDEAVVPFRYISKTQDFSGYAEIKAQGNSSMSYPKKNQTVKLFKDAACTERLKVDLKGWGKQNKFCFKANWIDLTHARNIVSARLWSDVVRSRTNFEELPELLRTSPNVGVIDGFPVKVYADGVYQGRYTLNIPKDKWTFNMNDELDKHCVLCGENYYSGCFRAAAQINGTDWTDEIHDTVPVSIKTRWNEVISFVMNSTDDEFRANLSQYFYVDSLIDYYLFGLASCGLDAFGKNQIYATYDGLKWIACMYDMDSTWGLYWNGSKFVSTDYARTSYEDFVDDREGNLLYIRLEENFYEELQSRWAELKSGALSIENIINRFERFTDIAPVELVAEDYAITTGNGKFTDIPSKTTNNIQQIRTYALARQVWTDEYVSALTGGGEVEPEITLTSISATYSGGNVAVGTSVSDLTGIVVTAHYSDGASETVTGYTLSGTIAEGSNTITVSYDGMTTTFTVVGVAEPGEGDSVVDYTKDALSGATWQEGYNVDKSTGNITAKASHYITEEIALQDCKYMLTPGSGNTHANIVVYDSDGTYLAAYEGKGSGTVTFIAKPEYKYRVQVYSTSVSYANATLMPVSVSGDVTYTSLALADMSWKLSNGYTEVILQSDLTTSIANADQANEFVLIVAGDFPSATKKINAPNIFVVDTKYNAFIVPYFTNVDTAASYFAENNVVIEFNKRYQ